MEDIIILKWQQTTVAQRYTVNGFLFELIPVIRPSASTSSAKATSRVRSIIRRCANVEDVPFFDGDDIGSFLELLLFSLQWGG